MTVTLLLEDHATRDDLRIFLERLSRAGEPEVRLVSHGSVVAAYGCVQTPAGILDTTPLVLGMRAFELRDEPSDVIDEVVPVRALLDRIARLGVIGIDLQLPETTLSAAWAGSLPPKTGWTPRSALDVASLAAVARDGITRVERQLPADPGEPVVRAVRASVWGAEMLPGYPAVIAFAAETLGFLHREERAIAAESGRWLRVSTSRGHVVLRRSAGSQTPTGTVG